MRTREVKYLSNGTTVANFRIATSENRVNKASGEKTTITEWHRVVAFGRLAEICGEYLNKGKQVYIEGRIRTRSWDDKQGNKRYTTEIVATQMQMLKQQALLPRSRRITPLIKRRDRSRAQATTMSPSERLMKKRPSAVLSSSFVIATYPKVRLIPQDFGRLASGLF